MKVALVAPRPAAVEPGSGGDRYDAELARALERAGHQVAGSEAPVELVDGLLFRQWRKRPGVKSVGLIHVPASFLDEDPALPPLEQAFFDQLDGVQFVSALTQRDTAARFRLPELQWVAEPGCSLPTAPRAPELLLLGVGHVLPNKRVHEAVALLGSLLDVPGWRAEWLGALDLAPEYVRSLGPPGPVVLRGRVPHAEVGRTLARAAALVCTSRYESWGLAAAEALACGVPVFAERKSGLSDFLGGAGHRHVKELRHFLTDPAWREAVQAEARAAAKLLPGWDRCAAITVKHLEAL